MARLVGRTGWVRTPLHGALSQPATSRAAAVGTIFRLGIWAQPAPPPADSALDQRLAWIADARSPPRLLRFRAPGLRHRPATLIPPARYGVAERLSHQSKSGRSMS